MIPTESVVTTPFGRFLVNERDIIESTLKAGTLWDGPGFLQPIALEYGGLGEIGTTILDVGANVGSFAIWLASRGAWRVVAVEPIPSTYTRLLANLDLNREPCADRVIPVPVAAYDRVRWLYPGPIDPGNVGGAALSPDAPPGTPPITAGNLDLYAWLYGTRVSLIKIDAQGCEGRILRGLAETIAQSRPAIVFEWEDRLAVPHGITLEATLEWLAAHHYHVARWPSHPDNFLARPIR